MADKLLEVKGVSKIFRVGGMLRGKKLVAVDNVSLSIDDDKPVILSIVGESGCGKSTLCKMILRLHNPDMGDIVLDGKSYADKKSYDPKQFKLDVQPIFQNPYESFSARKTVDTYLYNTALRLGIAKNRAEADKVVDEALKSVGMSLAVVKGKYATQFSGGELQRVSIARALITRPKLIIADEPVAAIDASMKMNIVNLFKELRDKYKISFIYITHDLSTAYYVSDYIATLYRGCLIEYGPAKQIMDNPAHPYTELLMSSVPRVGDKWEKEIAMPDMEGKEYAVEYCKFAPRCPYATDECRQKRPDAKDMGNGRMVLCCHPLCQQTKEAQDKLVKYKKAVAFGIRESSGDGSFFILMLLYLCERQDEILCWKYAFVERDSMSYMEKTVGRWYF